MKNWYKRIIWDWRIVICQDPKKWLLEENKEEENKVRRDKRSHKEIKR